MSAEPTVVDRRPALVEAYELAARIIEAIEAHQLGDATACPELDVASLVSHTVGAGWRAVDLGRGEAPTGDDFPDVALDAAPGALRRAGDEAATAWANDAKLTGLVTMPWGETYTGGTLVDMYLAELVTHTVDLAAATGTGALLDERLCALALEAARAMLKPEYRNLMGTGNPFGSEVEVATDGPASQRLAGFMGRPAGAAPAQRPATQGPASGRPPA